MIVLTSAFHAGFGVGLAIAVPIGPMGLLCIQRTLAAGIGAGVMTGLGAATVHAAYGGAAIIGIKSSTIATIEAGAPILQLLSATLLMVFAVMLMRRQVGVGVARVGTALPFHTCYRDALILGIANPLTLVLLAAAIPALTGLGDEGQAVAVLLGLFCGSVAWWLTLSTSVSLLRARFDIGAMRRINIVAALILGGMSVAAVTRAMR